LVLAFVPFMLPDAGAAVIEAARVLRPGGWLLAATWGSQLGTGAEVVVREELDRAGAPVFPELARSDAGTDSAEDMAALPVECRSRRRQFRCAPPFSPPLLLRIVVPTGRCGPRPTRHVLGGRRLPGPWFQDARRPRPC
jgi:SAM-dependent methyltransferase